jgi:hypothetical protein
VAGRASSEGRRRRQEEDDEDNGDRRLPVALARLAISHVPRLPVIWLQKESGLLPTRKDVVLQASYAMKKTGSSALNCEE